MSCISRRLSHLGICYSCSIVSPITALCRPDCTKWDECARNIGLVYLLFYQTLSRILCNFRGKIPIKSFELPTDINQLDVLGEMGVRASLR